MFNIVFDPNVIYFMKNKNTFQITLVPTYVNIILHLHFQLYFHSWHHFLQQQYVPSWLWQNLYVFGRWSLSMIWNLCMVSKHKIWYLCSYAKSIVHLKHFLVSHPKYVRSTFWSLVLGRQYSTSMWWKFGLVGIKFGDENVFTNKIGLGCSSSLGPTRTI